MEANSDHNRIIGETTGAALILVNTSQVAPQILEAARSKNMRVAERVDSRFKLVQASREALLTIGRRTGLHFVGPVGISGSSRHPSNWLRRTGLGSLLPGAAVRAALQRSRGDEPMR